MTEMADRLRAKILELVAEYSSEAFPEKNFVPGESFVPVAGRVFDARDVQSLIDSGLDFWLTEGRFARQFEKESARFFNMRHAILVNSGSSANLLALTCLTSPALGERQLQPGDEVITVAAGFPTTVNPIFQNGLIPVFVDVDIPTYNIDVTQLEPALSERTRAIMIAHTLGNPFNLAVVTEFAKQHNLWLIEDCCDAVGATYGNRMVGTFGDVATVSFYPAHHITMGEGGAVLTDKPKLKKLIESFRDWGRDCFPAGTKIETAAGLKNIEDVVVGDFVLSHDGCFREVEKLTGKRDTKFVAIKPRLMKEITATDNHPFLIQRSISHCSSNKEWVKAKDVKIGDFVLESIPRPLDNSPVEFFYSYNTEYQTKNEAVKIEPDLMRLIGYWLAEGSLASGLKGKSGYSESKYKFYRVDFSFNLREEETIDDVCNLMYKYFGVVGHVRQSHRKENSSGATLTFKTRKGYEFFYQFFGKGASTKQLPPDMINWDLSLGLGELIKGFWIGDGSSSRQGFSLCSVSESLMNQIRRLLLRYRIVGSFHERKVKNHHSSVVYGKPVKAKHILHSINFYGENAERFGDLIGEKFQAKSDRPKAVFDDEHVYYPIEKIHLFTSDTLVTVYNFEVRETHSYHANGLVVHNCWCEPGKDNTCGKRFDWQLGDLPHGYDHKYTYSHIGYNLKATDMQAAVGVSQLQKLPGFIEKRRANFNTLRQRLEPLQEYFILPEATPNSQPSWFGFPIYVRPEAAFTRGEAVRWLEVHKIGTRLLFGGNLVHQPAYRGQKYRIVGNLAHTQEVLERVFWIGVYPGLSGPMLDYMCEMLAQLCETAA
jgi:dTDP-4-amino-4,6-dideoxygalactose transaminase/intein/homing endonuclease